MQHNVLYAKFWSSSPQLWAKYIWETYFSCVLTSLGHQTLRSVPFYFFHYIITLWRYIWMRRVTQLSTLLTSLFFPGDWLADMLCIVWGSCCNTKNLFCSPSRDVASNASEAAVCPIWRRAWWRCWCLSNWQQRPAIRAALVRRWCSVRRTWQRLFHVSWWYRNIYLMGSPFPCEGLFT